MSVASSKTTTTSAAAEKDHKHAELEASIAALKKEIEALKGQCHSCCADLAELKSAPAPDVAARDPRVDAILEVLTGPNAHWPKYKKYLSFIK